VVRATPPDELAARAAAGTLTELDGIGATTAAVISEALAGDVPEYLTSASNADVAGADLAGGPGVPLAH
jgi:putative hydrolase